MSEPREIPDTPLDEPGEGGVDQELVDAGESGPRDGDIGQYEDEES
jgi:hypothetical protein